MKKIIVQLSIAISLSLVIFSCDNKYFFEAYHNFSGSGWHKDSVIVFNIPVNDTSGNYDMYINIRNSVKYNYSNIWLFIDIIQPGGEAVKDTFEVILAEPSGKWIGKGFAGLKTRKAVYRRQFFFPVSGDYKINVQHGMRQDLLKGINDIGLTIGKNKP